VVGGETWEITKNDKDSVILWAVLRVKLDAVIDARLDRGGQADFLPLRNYLTPKVLSELGY